MQNDSEIQHRDQKSTETTTQTKCLVKDKHYLVPQGGGTQSVLYKRKLHFSSLTTALSSINAYNNNNHNNITTLVHEGSLPHYIRRNTA